MVAFRVLRGGPPAAPGPPGRRPQGVSTSICGMSERAARWSTALAGVGGCLLVAAVQSSSHGGGFSPRLGVAGSDRLLWPDPFATILPTGATVLALCLLRWWPYLLSAG